MVPPVTLPNTIAPAAVAPALSIDWLGRRWELLPHKALHWPAQRTVIVADVHFGKPAAFRSLGVPVPEAATTRDLARLAALIRTTGCEHLIVLGDLLHARHGRAEQTMRTIRAWRENHRALAITLVRGNHDRAAGDPPGEWNFKCVDEPFALDGIDLRHAPIDPGAGPARGRPFLAGHVHPCVRLRDIDGSTLRTPCFLFGERAALLPAFGSFTGAHPIKPRMGDRVFAVGQGAIIEVAGVCTA